MENKRDKGIYIKLTQREIDLIDQKMALIHTRNRSAFIRKMSIDGLIIHLDMTELKEILRLLKITANNINQLAKRAHETGSIATAHVDDAAKMLGEIRLQVGKVLESLTKLQNRG